MKTQSTLNAILAGVGGVSLLIYILACSTSFSPDDRLVLYPSFDPQSGASAVAQYDRKKGKSEILFSAADANTTTNPAPALLRAEWMPDGKHILIGRVFEKERLELLVLPRGVKEPTRQLWLPKDISASSLELPFAINGSQLFLTGEKPLSKDDRASVVRVNLTTGELTCETTSSNPIVVLPSSDGKSLIALRHKGDSDLIEYGLLDPGKMLFKTVGFTGNYKVMNKPGLFPLFNPTDGSVFFVDAAGKEAHEMPQVYVVKDGKVVFSRLLSRPGGFYIPGPFLAAEPDGKTLMAAAVAASEGQTNGEYGLLEIPLNDAPLRFTPLFRAEVGKEGELIFAQPSLSHDGKTWAVSTAFLYMQNESLKPEDCALFLIDLSTSKRPVTRVPIRVPPEREPLLK
jgi:hypothetical protein